MKTRPIKITKDYIKHAEGSCMISMGNTMVLCVATVEEKVPPFIESKGTQQGWVTAEYSMLPRAGKERSSRQKGSGSGRSQEISRLIGRSLRAVVDMKKLGPRTIILDCDVIKADGGTRTASINGSFIALALAVKKLLKAGKITQNPISDYLGALSVGIVDGKKIPDLCYEQDVKAEVDMNIVSTGAGKLVEVQGTAEGKVFSRKDLNDLIDLAQSGIKEIIATQKTIIGKLN